MYEIFKENLLGRIMKLQKSTDYLSDLILKVLNKEMDPYSAASKLSNILNQEEGRMNG